MAKTLPVPVGALRGLLKEIAVSARDAKPLVVGGARELAPMLRRELGHDAAPGGVRDSAEARGAAVYVHVMGGTDDAAELKRARRARVPIIAVADARVDAVPHVLATDVVRLPPGQGFPVDEIAAAIAHRLGEDGAPLAARVPVLRREVARELIGFFSRKNGLVGAAVFVPGVDLPILALNQLRLVLRLHQAYGLEVDPRERLPEIVATVGAGFGFRAVARELLDLVPPGVDEVGPDLLAGRRRLRRRRFQRLTGWAIKGGVAYAGTRALGEATLRRLEPGGHG